MKQIRLIELVSGMVRQELAPEIARSVMVEWDEAYCPLSMTEREALGLNQFRWHVFSSGAYPSLSGNEAMDEYVRHVARSYYVVPETTCFLREVSFEVDQLPSPELAKTHRDFYVFPRNLAWTMAFTHEHGWIGSFFAKHKNYHKLNAKNLQSMAAQQKGWS
jgi:hypothetical protein